jgi:hypothetical protein
VKSQKTPFFVIPAKAGIQYFRKFITDLDPGFRRGDDFYEVVNFIFMYFAPFCGYINPLLENIHSSCP